MPMFSHFLFSLALHFIVWVRVLLLFFLSFFPISRTMVHVRIADHNFRSLYVKTNHTYACSPRWSTCSFSEGKNSTCNETLTVCQTQIFWAKEKEEKNCGKNPLLWRQSQTLFIHWFAIATCEIVFFEWSMDMEWKITHTKLIAIKANNIETVGEEDKHFMVSMEKVCEIIHS